MLKRPIIRYHTLELRVLDHLGCRNSFAAFMGSIAATLDVFVFGFILYEHSRPGREPTGLVTVTTAMLTQYAEEHLLNVQEFALEVMLTTTYSLVATFECGLELLLHGIDAQPI